jgi:hypothetical protein
MVDPNSGSLNRFTASLARADALTAEITSITQCSGQSRKSLITCVQPVPMPAVRTSRYDRRKLYKEVWKTPMKKLAKQYGVSASGLRKACTRLQIPVPGYGDRARREANQPPPPLPKLRVHRRESLQDPSSEAATQHQVG